MANGCSVTTASRKMMVSPANKMFSAISLGVFCRSAPSTRAIMRSRKVSPGFDVTFTLIWSESTRVPPVTAERSPPDSRMTGADSPVMADSSTEATPLIISPSDGMSSPADTNTTSPARSFELCTCSVRSPSIMRLAIVSERAFLRVSACALPRPSAMASAKLANNTVNHSHNVICKLNLKAAPPRNSNTVVITLPISTTNITGLPIMWRGSSLTMESRTARRTILPCQTAFDFDLSLAMLEASERLTCRHQQVLKDWSQAKRREKCQRADDQDHADQKHGEQRCRHRERPQRWRNIFFLRQIAGDSQHRDHHQETPDQHGEADGRVVPERVGTEPAKCGAVVAGPGNKCVQHLAEAVRPRIGDGGSAKTIDRGKGSENQNHEWKDERHQHGHLHVVGFYLLAEIF